MWYRGPRSTLSVLRPGLAVTELAVSNLPGNPTAIFTMKRAPDDEYDGFIVVSFTNATLVFEIGEEVKETSDSGFLGTVATLHTQLLEDGSMLQVGGCACWYVSRTSAAHLLCRHVIQEGLPYAEVCLLHLCHIQAYKRLIGNQGFAAAISSQLEAVLLLCRSVNAL